MTYEQEIQRLRAGYPEWWDTTSPEHRGWFHPVPDAVLQTAERFNVSLRRILRDVRS